MTRKTKETSASDEDSKGKLMDALKIFVRTRGSEYLKDRNISSVGIGYKKKDGKSTKDLAIQFTVNKKAQLEKLESLNTIALPKSFTIQGIEVPTDVIQRKYKVEYRVIAEVSTIDGKKRLNPIVPGISVANTRVSAGTIGCIVYDSVTGAKYILSNWHVLHGPRGAVGDEIVQPGPFDDNRLHLNLS